MHCEKTGSWPSASLAVLSPLGDIFISLGINKSAPCFCLQPEDLVIPHIGPEFIAALRDNTAPERSNTVDGGSVMKQEVAKTARSFIALFVSKLRAIKAKKTLRLQPPSMHPLAPSHCSVQRKDALRLDKIIAVIDAEEITSFQLPLRGRGSPK
jgi:hypothetical protein